MKKLLKWDDILKQGTPFLHVHCVQKDIKIKCSVCKGKGEVAIEGHKYTCPECYGKGFEWGLEPMKWQIRPSWHTEYWVISRVEINGANKEGMYRVMYWDEGNGFDAEYSFASKIAATKACKKLNEKLEKEVSK